MAKFVVATPDITWTGSPVADSKITWQQATINVQAGSNPYLSTTNIQRAVPDLKRWSGSLTGFLGTPVTGVALNVSMTDGYDDHVESWTLNHNVAEQLVYTSAESGGWMAALPSTPSWSGSYTCRVDDANPLVAPGDVAKELVLTLSSGNTITGDAIITDVSPVFQIGGIPVVTISFAGDDTLVVAGSNNITAAANPLVAMAANTLTIKAHEVGTTDVQYSGSAFFTQLSVTANTSGLVTYGINFRGSGALTIVDPAV